MSAGSLKVKIFEAKGTNVVPVAKSTVTVGSHSHCDVVLEHATVQEEHVRAWLEGGRIWIQDLGTTAGTFLNGIRLPPLKPMLVRDLDVLKLGDCPATLGLEANLVRAPVVKTQAPVEQENTLTDIKPLTAKDPELEKRRDELAKVSRELAELKLQLQMGRMEKSSTEEMRKQINGLRDELRQLTEQREKMNETLKRLSDEKHAKISSTESEIIEMKLKAERDIKDMRDAQGRKLGHWKVDAVADLNRQLHAITVQKQKSWQTRPLSQDMIFEWEGDLNLMFRRVLLEENVHPAQHVDHTATVPLTRENGERPPPLSTKTKGGATGTGVTASATRSKSKRRKHSEDINWSRMGLVAIALAFMGIVGWVAKPYIGRSAVRGIASAPQKVPTARTPQAQAPARFAPKQNRTYKKSYTENVLYTENYTDTEMNREFRSRWLADLAKAARTDWKVDEKTVMSLASKEQQLIADLLRLREGIQVQRETEGIAQMRARENAFSQELLTLLKSPQLVDKYMRLKRSFFTKNQQSPSRQSR
ncbi:MAG: FHA domain-containing protein [Bdellovibrionales bacterium]|nr:FHA domain-containing protein [Bdellovibrionales bacterium]